MKVYSEAKIDIHVMYYKYKQSKTLFPVFCVSQEQLVRHDTEQQLESRFMNQKTNRSRDSSLGIATGYEPDIPGSISARQNISLLHSVQIGSDAHPASYPMGAWSNFSGGKPAGARS
jgi:hypothetical protein